MHILFRKRTYRGSNVRPSLNMFSYFKKKGTKYVASYFKIEKPDKKWSGHLTCTILFYRKYHYIYIFKIKVEAPPIYNIYYPKD